MEIAVLLLFALPVVSSFQIESGKLTGVPSRTGLGNVLPYINSILIPSGNGVVNCTKASVSDCPSCPTGDWVLDPTTKMYRCACLFGQTFKISSCNSFQINNCVEALNTQNCGVTNQEALKFATGFLSTFGYTLKLNSNRIAVLEPIDILDTFRVCQFSLEAYGGLYPLNLTECLRWVKSIVVSYPEGITNLDKSSVDAVAMNIKAAIGFWQFPIVSYRGQDIMVNGLNMTAEVTQILATMFGSSWTSFGSAVAEFIRTIPQGFDFKLPVDKTCPPTWWTCMAGKDDLVKFLYYLLLGMNLSHASSYDLSKIADENDIGYLYQFYNLAVSMNLNGGFSETEVHDSLLSLYLAVKALTDESPRDISIAKDIRRFKVMTQSFGTPRIVITSMKVFLNGQPMWAEFASVYLNLERGYVNIAAAYIGQILLKLNTPAMVITSELHYANESSIGDSISIKAATAFYDSLIWAFVEPSSSLRERRRLGMNMSEECLDEGVDLAKLALGGWKRGKWNFGILKSVELICQVVDATSKCQDSFSIPEEAGQICDLLTNWPNVVVDTPEYVFDFAKDNIFPLVVTVGNSIHNAIGSLGEDLTADAAHKLGGWLNSLFNRGTGRKAVFALLCLASSL